MNEQTVALKARTKKLALEVIRFVRLLPSNDEGRIIGRQLKGARSDLEISDWRFQIAEFQTSD